MSDEHYIINPGRKRRRGGKRRTTRRASSYRKNPVANPRRRKRRVGSVRVYYRNPRRRKLLSLQGIGLKDILWGTGGMIATETAGPQAARMLNQSEFSIGGYAAKAAAALLVSYAVRRFVNRKAGQAVLFGALMPLAKDLYTYQVKPRLGLSGVGYTRTRLAIPATRQITAPPASRSLYLPAVPNRLRALY